MIVILVHVQNGASCKAQDDASVHRFVDSAEVCIYLCVVYN